MQIISLPRNTYASQCGRFANNNVLCCSESEACIPELKNIYSMYTQIGKTCTFYLTKRRSWEDVSWYIRGRADESTSDMMQSVKTLVFGAKDHQNTYLYPNEILLYVLYHVQTSGCSKDCVSTFESVTQFPACFVLTKHDLCLILTKRFQCLHLTRT